MKSKAEDYWVWEMLLIGGVKKFVKVLKKTFQNAAKLVGSAMTVTVVMSTR